MKSVIILSLLLASTSAFARSLAPLTCTAGTMGEDSYVAVTLIGGSVSIQMHESNISANPSQTIVAGNTLAILDKDLKVIAEGDESVMKTNALLVYNNATKTLKATLLLNGNIVLNTLTLKCQ